MTQDSAPAGDPGRGTAVPGVLRLRLPWLEPPLNVNALPRNHAARQEKINAVQYDVAWLCRAQPRAVRAAWPYPGLVEIVLVVAVVNRRRRDAENYQPSVKAAVDGLVKAGVLVDDNWQRVRSAYPVIELGPKPGCVLVVTPV